MSVEPFKEHTRIPDKTFPINLFRTNLFYLHWHDHLEWVFVRKGKVRIQVDATFDEVSEGEFVFVNSRQLHAGTPLEQGTSMVAIVFNEALLRNTGLDSTEERYILPLLSGSLPFPNVIKLTDPMGPEINASVSRLIEELENRNVGHELFVKAELYRIFGLIFRNRRELASHPAFKSAKHDHFNQILHYIREHYHSALSVEQMARMVSMSPNHFCSVFKRVTSKTLIEYVHLLRVNEAERLLKETDLYVTEIAHRVGFGDINYFGRVFKKYRNVSPTELRKQLPHHA